jgi:sugar phosphate isomerase/epimerase
MQLGCNTVLFSSVDLATALTHIAWAGYQHVELAAVAGMCEHVSPALDPAGVREVRRMLADHGLEATAMEAATTDRTRLEALFALAGDLGVPIVNVGSGGVTGDEESTRQAIAHIGELAGLAGRYGVRLAVKPHVGQAIYNGATALRLMDAVREPALGLNFDPSHLFRAGEEPQEVARRWGAHIITSHIRDCPHRGPGPSERSERGASARRAGADPGLAPGEVPRPRPYGPRGEPDFARQSPALPSTAQPAVGPGRPEEQVPGRGIVDIPATLRALDAIGYAGPLNLEVIGATEYPLSRAMGIAAEARGYLHRCLQELGKE